jgi:phospholipase C
VGDLRDTERLQQIKHIVVLMMENRSFDHMLGYLKQDGLPEVNGLTGDESNLDDTGERIGVFEFGDDRYAFHRPDQPFDDSLDPEHGRDAVAKQLANGNDGFVTNFIEAKQPPREWRSLPMGHYAARHVPVYDFLARRFCVCDRWHSSVPGDTWENRNFALAARRADPVGLKLRPWERFAVSVGLANAWRGLEHAPIFDVPAFTRHLRLEQWRWYSYDPATLRAADGRYRKIKDIDRKNFAYVNRKSIMPLLRLVEEPLEFQDSFLDDATKSGEHGLRQVSWVDPNFIDVRVLDPTSNDDHPPSDIRAGQQLVLELYNALVHSPEWNDTLFVITYDEHGGFFDHVVPPPVEADDTSTYATYGVRVPTIVVGPRVRKFACHRFFEHTTLMKTILLRFAANPERAIAAMGPRVVRAEHLGVLLDDEPRTDVAADDHDYLFDILEKWRTEARDERRASTAAAPATDPDGAGRNWRPTELQHQFATFSLAMRQRGLVGRP